MFNNYQMINVYTREQALSDGLLIDVTETAKEAGIRIPVAITAAVWNEIIIPDEVSKDLGQDEKGRLWDVLWMYYSAVRNSKDGGSHLNYQLYVVIQGSLTLVTLKGSILPGDSGEPVVTIQLPNED